MIKVIGIRFRSAGKIYFFDPLQFDIKRGDHVIVETARGIEFGTAVSDVREVTDDKVVMPIKPVLRIATEKDVEQAAGNKLKEKEAFQVCQEKIRKHNLEMKLIDAEYTFDNNKVLFYFTADGRIDFRELVKDLAAIFKTRIELRQIGVRDETKIVGGIGICGRPLCCHTHLSDFIPVSIKMAKEQNLSLNPAKISGVCGRLMCCLKHEEDTYEELNRRLPGIGDFVTTDDGLKGEVQSVNVLRQRVKILVDVNDEKEIHEYEVERLHFKKKHGRKEQENLSPEELRELELLEKEEQETSKEGNEKEHGPKKDNAAKGDQRQNRQEKFDKQDKSERGERGDRFEKRGKDRFDNENRQDKNDRHGKNREMNGQNQSRENHQNRENNQGNNQGGSQGNNQSGNQGNNQGGNQGNNQGGNHGNHQGNRNNHRKFDKRNHFDRKKSENDGQNGNKE